MQANTITRDLERLWEAGLPSRQATSTTRRCATCGGSCSSRRVDGGPPKMVQQRMGHAAIAITMDVYGHLFPRGDDGAELAAAEQALLV